MLFHRIPIRTGAGRIAASGALVALMLLVAGCGAFAGEPPAPTPTPIPPLPALEKPKYTVKRGRIVEQLQLSGRVAAVKEDALSFTRAGNVARILVRPDETVKKGRILVELQQGESLNQLKQAQVRLDQAELALRRGQEQQKANVTRAELDLEEAEVMLDAAANETERKLADIAVRRAKINLAEAKAVTNADLEKQVDQARLDFERIQETVDAGRLYAPYAGVVAGVSAAPGDPVEAYKPVLTVLDPANRELRVENVLSTDVAKLSTNQEVDINFSRHEGQTVKGVIERLPGDPAQPGSGAQTDNSVHISFDPGELEVEIGDLAAVVVTLRKKENILYLPPQAIRTFQGRRFVVTEADGRQRRVDVELGIASGDQVEVIEGVTEGQVVIGQ